MVFFFTQSLYKDIMRRDTISGKILFWKTRLPLKIKIFLSYLKRGVVLTKDNLLKRGWKGETKCNFCDMEKTIQHLFFECHSSKGVWNSLFIMFNLKPQKDIVHLFGPWLRSFHPSLRKSNNSGVHSNVLDSVVV